ncbi:MEDS domain-containing protein [Actinokineospora cianjurensis]|uniref:MEDS domain-containing protein n=1 Tax=Actinokineospora cianjurensis TaxID=585224 RepID=UPI001FE48FAE|nr:MEDS domain-containing protein [Actinokineospora cianjurensis]
MRSSGVLDHVRGLGVHDHVCWGYRDPDDFRDHAGGFLVDGLAIGQRPQYVVTSQDAPRALARLRRDPRLDRAVRDGVLQVTAIDAAYAGEAAVDPAAQVDWYVAATQDAVAAGFTGLRVVGEATPLVGTAGQFDAFARYEHLMDRRMPDVPFAALCGYDLTVLGEPAVAQIAVMHPFTNLDRPGFRLCGSPLPGCAVAIGGELDLANADLFAAALDRADLPVVDGTITLDCTDLEFIDHRALITLAERAGDATLVLLTPRSGPSRVVDLLGLRSVRVERPA